MFEPKTKAITRWGLSIKGTDVYFPKKETAINVGRLTLKMNPETEMFEEYRLWDLTSGVPQLIDEQRFDRTILIQQNSNMIKWLKKKFGITELINEQKKTNDLLLKILSESGKTANSVRAYNRAYHIQDY